MDYIRLIFLNLILHLIQFIKFIKSYQDATLKYLVAHGYPIIIYKTYNLIHFLIAQSKLLDYLIRMIQLNLSLIT